MTLAKRAVQWLQRPAVAAVVLAGLLAYAVGGWPAVGVVLAVAVAVAVWPRLRQRVVKWWLLR